MRVVGNILLAALPLLSAGIPIKEENGISISLTKRHNFVDEHGYSQLDLVAAHLDRRTDTIVDGLEAYKTNTGSEHPTLFVDPDYSALRKRQRSEGASYLMTPNVMVWFGAVNVGTPPQQLLANFDAANAVTMFPGKACQTGNCLNHTLYDYDASSTAKQLNGTFNMRTGDNSTSSGGLWTDTVSVGTSTGHVTAQNQTLAVASTLNSGYNISRFLGDGSVGVAFSTISPLNTTSFFDTLVVQQQLKQNLISMYLNTNHSEIRFGAINNNLYKGSFTHVPLGPKAYWEMQVGAFVVNGTNTVTNLTSIVDPGATFIITSNATAAAIYQQIPGAKYAPPEVGDGLWIYSCDAVPDVGLKLGQNVFHIDPKFFNRGKIPSMPGYCVGGISVRPNIKFTIIGDVFLVGAKVYVVLNAQENRISFAPQALLTS